MSTLTAIIIFGLLMSSIALIGSVILLLPKSLLSRIIHPLVSFAAGSLLGGAIFHLLPHAIIEYGNSRPIYLALALGFVMMFILEQFLQWHHCHRAELPHRPVSYLILLADGLHNLIGGISVGAAFVIDIKLGITVWFVAVAHEIPQELGDFGILLFSGWGRMNALLFNFISALTFPLGALIAYFSSSHLNQGLLLAFGAGNFIYICAADLIPQLQTDQSKEQVMNFTAFVLGLMILYLI